jgi:hypothetical protein
MILARDVSCYPYPSLGVFMFFCVSVLKYENFS